MPLAELGQLERKLELARSVEDVAAEIIHIGRLIIGCDGVTFVVNDHGFCHYLDADGISPLWKGQVFPADTCISGWVMINRQPVTIPNIRLDPRIPQDVYRRTFVKSMQMVPVGERGEAAIGAYWAEYHDPTEGETLSLHALARLAALSLKQLKASV